jgi:hypothetical protein
MILQRPVLIIFLLFTFECLVIVTFNSDAYMVMANRFSKILCLLLLGYNMVSMAPLGSTWRLGLGKFILLYVVFLVFSTNVALIQYLDGSTPVLDIFSQLNDRGRVYCSGMDDVELEMSRKFGNELLTTSKSTILDIASRTDKILQVGEKVLETSVFLGISTAAVRSYLKLKPETLNLVETFQKNKSLNSTQKIILLGATLKTISLVANSTSGASSDVLSERTMALVRNFDLRYGVDLSGVSPDICKALLFATEGFDKDSCNESDEVIKKGSKNLSVEPNVEVDIDAKNAITPTERQLTSSDRKELTIFKDSRSRQ